MIDFYTKDIKLNLNNAVLSIPEGSITELNKALEDHKLLRVQISIPRKKRSLNANSLCWALCQQIAEKLSNEGTVTRREDIYRREIKEMFAPVIRAVPLEDKDFWIELWRARGIGFIADVFSKNDYFVELAFWNGSSTFDTKQMSRLIDGLIDEARCLGISVITDADKDLLLKSWVPEKERG